MRDRMDIITQAENILGEELDGLIHWYQFALESDWDYKIFIVRRSYILALILEQITGLQIEDYGKDTFLTDASILLHCEELVQQYRSTGAFPTILICDDILIHGRNINHCIEEIEQRVLYLLKNTMDESYDEERIRDDLAKAIAIYVYARAEGPLLLDARYELKYKFEKEMKTRDWHQLASDISTLILYSDITNATYIYSEQISRQEYERYEGRLKPDEIIHTSYQNIRQHTRVQYLQCNKGINAIYSLRMIENPINADLLRVVPFVFVPNLSEEQTYKFHKKLIDIIRRKEYGLQLERILKKTLEISGKRSYSELLSLILSYALLYDFNREIDIQEKEEDKKYEIKKLSRNYMFYDMKETSELLELLLNDPPLKNKEELDNFLKDIIPEEKAIKVVEDDGRFSEKKLVRDLEDRMYEMGVTEERKAVARNHTRSILPRKSLAGRSVEGCFFFLKDVSDSYSIKKLKSSIAYFLQMMDAGVLSLTALASRNVWVVGYSQFIKAGEQSLLLLPLRNYEYTSMLGSMYSNCRYRRMELQDELERYAKSGDGNLTKDVVDDLCKLVYNLNSIEQTPNDWNGNYIMKINVDDINEREDALLKYALRRIRHRKDYENYVEKQEY